MIYMVMARKEQDHGYVHVFQTEYKEGQATVWRTAVCGFERVGTFLACTESEDYPICPVCNRWLIMVELSK